MKSSHISCPFTFSFPNIQCSCLESRLLSHRRNLLPRPHYIIQHSTQHHKCDSSQKWIRHYMYSIQSIMSMLLRYFLSPNPATITPIFERTYRTEISNRKLSPIFVRCHPNSSSLISEVTVGPILYPAPPFIFPFIRS
jgi:hypothetical protein